VKRDVLLTLVAQLKSSGAGLWRHSLNTANLTRALLKLFPPGALGVREEDLFLAALLHDVGKTQLDPALLEKPGPLTPQEWMVIRQHPPLSVALIRQLDPEVPARITALILYHHEHWDGKGYFGLAGTAIPAGARLLAIADALEAMLSNRPYRPSLTWAEAILEIEKNAGTQFDAYLAGKIVRHLRAMEKDYQAEPASLTVPRLAAGSKPAQ